MTMRNTRSIKGTFIITALFVVSAFTASAMTVGTLNGGNTISDMPIASAPLKSGFETAVHVDTLMEKVVATGRNMDQLLLDQLNGLITSDELDSRYKELVTRLERINSSIANTVISEIRDSKSNHSLYTINEYLYNLCEEEKTYFNHAIGLISEKLLNMQYADGPNRLVVDSIKIVYKLSTYMCY